MMTSTSHTPSLPYSTLIGKFNQSIVTHRPETTLMYGTQLIHYHQKSLKKKDALYHVLEQVYLASLIFQKSNWSEYCYNQLKQHFSPETSSRMNRLKGMALEATGDFDSAKTHYKNIIKRDPVDLITRKRYITILKSEGKYTECIQLLNSHLAEFSTDVESWTELAFLYQAHCSFEKAIYCYEEILLHNPQKVSTIISLAELYVMNSQYDLSRKYYCMALMFNPESWRALWGLVILLCNTYDPKMHNQQKSNITKLIKKSTEKLKNAYQEQLDKSDDANRVWLNGVYNYIEKLQASVKLSPTKEPKMEN